MNYQYGNKNDNQMYGTPGTDVFYGRGGKDDIESYLDESSPYAEDRFYGGAGADRFELDFNLRVEHALETGELATPLIYGGPGRDSIYLNYEAHGSVDLTRAPTLFDLKSIEVVWHNLYKFRGDIRGSGDDDRLELFAVGDVDVELGGGSDLISLTSKSGKAFVDGGAGADVFACRVETGARVSVLEGGAGSDTYFLDNSFAWKLGHDRRSISRMEITDFQPGDDQFVVDLAGFVNVTSLDRLNPVESGKLYREHISYDQASGEVFVNDHLRAILDNSPRLSSDDSYFFDLQTKRHK